MSAPKLHPVTRWLQRAPAASFSAYAIFAAFSVYFCMYAFRKPFAVATFEGQVELGILPAIDYKILLIISQVLGYCASKFLGIKIVSEMSPRKRGLAVILSIGTAEAALALFAITPAPYNAIWMVLNGLPLGMVWGLVFGFLEGRKLSELLGAGLSASYIVASGAVKSVGRQVLDWGVSEQHMPVVTGLLFIPFTLLVIWMLTLLPPPTAEDEAARTKRQPMDGAARSAFVKRYLPGLFFLTLLYIFLTAYRDFRDNFARELWDALGFEGTPSIFALSELPIAFGVLMVLAFVMLIRSNRGALLAIHWIMAGGTALIGISTFCYQMGWLGPAPWMILVGLGLYIAYVPYGCVLFDRLIAAVGHMATAGFMIYVTDAFGYLGSVGILLYKNFGQAELSWREFFIAFSYVTSVVATLSFIASRYYFANVTQEEA